MGNCCGIFDLRRKSSSKIKQLGKSLEQRKLNKESPAHQVSTDKAIKPGEADTDRERNELAALTAGGEVPENVISNLPGNQQGAVLGRGQELHLKEQSKTVMAKKSGRSDGTNAIEKLTTDKSNAKEGKASQARPASLDVEVVVPFLLDDRLHARLFDGAASSSLDGEAIALADKSKAIKRRSKRISTSVVGLSTTESLHLTLPSGKNTFPSSTATTVSSETSTVPSATTTSQEAEEFDARGTTVSSAHVAKPVEVEAFLVRIDDQDEEGDAESTSTSETVVEPRQQVPSASDNAKRRNKVGKKHRSFKMCHEGSLSSCLGVFQSNLKSCI